MAALDVNHRLDASLGASYGHAPRVECRHAVWYNASVIGDLGHFSGIVKGCFSSLCERKGNLCLL